MDLGLYQKEVAKFFGVKTDTITLWEKNRRRPCPRRLPIVRSFLNVNSQEEFRFILGPEGRLRKTRNSG